MYYRDQLTNLGIDPLTGDDVLYICRGCGCRGSISISDYERHPFTEAHPSKCPAREFSS